MTKKRGGCISGVLVSLILCFMLSIYIDYAVDTVPFRLYCDLLNPGMSQAEVGSALQKIGSYSSHVNETTEPNDSPRIYIEYQNPLIRIGTGTIVLIYQNDELVSVGSRTLLGDPRSLPECR